MLKITLSNKVIQQLQKLSIKLLLQLRGLSEGKNSCVNCGRLKVGTGD